MVDEKFLQLYVTGSQYRKGFRKYTKSLSIFLSLIESKIQHILMLFTPS